MTLAQDIARRMLERRAATASCHGNTEFLYAAAPEQKFGTIRQALEG